MANNPYRVHRDQSGKDRVAGHVQRRALLTGGLAALDVSLVKCLTEPALAQGVGQEEASAIRAQLERWRQLYSYGDKPFSFAGFEDLYVNDESLSAYDNFSDDTRIQGWAAYRGLWEPLINANFTGQVTSRFVVHRVEVSGDLAFSTLEQWFSAKNKGQPFNSSQYATHVWRKAAGRWRIIHEHINGPVRVGGKEVLP